MKKKALLSPLAIIIMIIVFGVGVAGAAIYFGGAGLTGDVSLQKSLVAHWKFDGNAKDSSSYGNDATVIGATLSADRKNEANSAYQFDGAGNRISASSSSSLKPTTEVTIEFWVKPD